MAINGISSSTFSLPFQLRSPAQMEATSGGTGDSVTLSSEGAALAKATLHVKALEIEAATDSPAEGDGFVARLQADVAKTLDYLGKRLAKVIGRLDENGDFTGEQKKALESLQAKLERSMKGNPLRRTLDILEDGAKSLEGALGQGMEEIISDTMRYFRLKLNETFANVRVVNPLALDTGDLLCAGPVSAEDAVRIYDQYDDIIPLPENLPQSQPGKGLLYNEQPETPAVRDALKTLYSEIDSGFESLLRETLGPGSSSMETLSDSFVAQARPALYRQRGRQKPDLSEALDSGLKGMTETLLQREDGLKRVAKDMDEVIGEALRKFKDTGFGLLMTGKDVDNYDDQARRLSEQLAKIKAIVDAYKASQEAEAASSGATSGVEPGQSASSEAGAVGQGPSGQLDALV